MYITYACTSHLNGCASYWESRDVLRRASWESWGWRVGCNRMVVSLPVLVCGVWCTCTYTEAVRTYSSSRLVNVAIPT